MIYLSLPHMRAVLASLLVFFLFVSYLAWREKWEW